MAQRDPIQWPGSDDEPVVVPRIIRRRAPLHLPRRDSVPTISIWRTIAYFVLLVIALVFITYLVVRPR